MISENVYIVYLRSGEFFFYVIPVIQYTQFYKSQESVGQTVHPFADV